MDTVENRRIIIGTAGHIDHGKSTLIEALTGTDPDRLLEEKRRGITIELGFAQLELPDGTIAGIVDVPGHERFIRQMISGASGISLALVCIAADDGMMPQTREHLTVLQLLDVTNCVIALTKCDTVDEEWVSLVQEEIREELSSTPFSNAPIIPVSAKNGEGLDKLKDALVSCSHEALSASSSESVRMPIDRVFTIKGAGTVVTGTLWRGSIHAGDELELLPSHKKARVRTVQVHDQEVPLSTPGTRTALNLVGVNKSDLKPGDFLTTPKTLQVSDRFDAQFTYIPVLSAKKPLESGLRVHIAHGTREVVGRVLFMNGQSTLEPNETAFAQIRLNEPLPVSRGDHFIVRLLSPSRVIGGGTILNARPKRRTTLNENDSNLLAALARNDEAEICTAIIDSSTTPVSLTEIKQITGLSSKRIGQLLSEQTTGKGKPRYVQLSHDTEQYFAQKPVIQKQVMTLENILLNFHAENPAKTGISKGALQQKLPYHLEEGCFEAVLEESIRQEKIVIHEGEISHPKASAGARNLEEQTAQTLESLLVSYGATPPVVADLFVEAGIDQSRGAKALTLLEQQQKTCRISKTLCFAKPVLDAFYEKAKAYLLENEQGSATQLKEAMGTSRKYAIPLLEYFDDQKLTIRKGDVRILPEK